MSLRPQHHHHHFLHGVSSGPHDGIDPFFFFVPRPQRIIHILFSVAAVAVQSPSSSSSLMMVMMMIVMGIYAEWHSFRSADPFFFHSYTRRSTTPIWWPTWPSSTQPLRALLKFIHAEEGIRPRWIPTKKKKRLFLFSGGVAHVAFASA